MLIQKEKLLSYLDKLPIDQVRSAWIARIRVEHSRMSAVESWLIESGMERVDATGHNTEDGREVLHVRGVAYALRKDVHAERIALAFEDAKKAQPKPESEIKSVVGTEALSVMICPKCGDTLQHSGVCPSCAAGRLGYRHRYSCVCGGVDLISKEAL